MITFSKGTIDFLLNELNGERVNFLERRRIPNNIIYEYQVPLYNILNGKIFATAVDRILIMAFIFQEQNSLGVDKNISGCHGH